MIDNIHPPLLNAAESVTLRGVTVVDTRDGSLTPDVDVVVTAGRIAAITPADVARAATAGDVDGTGKFVIPGLLDMHVHALGLADYTGTLALMLANGITGFRQMAGSTRQLRQRASGGLSLPLDSPALLATPGALLTPTNAGSPTVVVRTVREQHAAGADFIKAGLISPSVLAAAQVEARRLGIPVVGHLPVGVDVRAAARDGLRAIEHLGPGVGILAACSTDEDDIIATLTARPARQLPFRLQFLEPVLLPLLRNRLANPVLVGGTQRVGVLRRAVATFDEDKARGLAEELTAAGTWQCPTLIRERTSQCSDDPEFRDDPHQRYIDPATLKVWQDSGTRFDALDPDTKTVFSAGYALLLRLTKIFDDAGARIIAGSDSTGAAWEVPGFALHQEFDELARAGLTPLRVLQTATLHAAEFLGLDATAGTVEVGKDADLVVLDANPLEQVANLHTVHGVVRAGRYYAPADLEAIKLRVSRDRSAGRSSFGLRVARPTTIIREIVLLSR